ANAEAAAHEGAARARQHARRDAAARVTAQLKSSPPVDIDLFAAPAHAAPAAKPVRGVSADAPTVTTPPIRPFAARSATAGAPIAKDVNVNLEGPPPVQVPSVPEARSAGPGNDRQPSVPSGVFRVEAADADLDSLDVDAAVEAMLDAGVTPPSRLKAADG